MSAPENLRNAPAVWAYDVERWTVWAGKTAQDNDRLSIKVARGNDWWFHLKGMPSSHVVLFVRDGDEPPKHVIEQAAAICAWHSKQRSGGICTVNYCRAKHVTKPRGAKAGTVQIKREAVLKVRPSVPG
jgi:predicted ribosome quality control (RQC) complex YloA/Tae2 family protein